MTMPKGLRTALADRYRIERELGAGGMATVYLAEDLKHHRKVAIKVLKPELAAVLGAERFVQEIQTTAQLQHPHILPLFDSGSADGFLFYVMPYIEGETLRNKLDRETQLGVDEAVRITTEVADALDYAHRHGVVHRDIKPENILLHDGRPMVADFGIALALSAAAGGRMTETGMSLGTPHYMSPEQATADKEITARSDIYSLASVLYEMLTGEPPHMGNSAQQIIMKIIAEPVRPVTTLRKNVPPNVAAALAKALEKLPADRFATAKEFADALNNPGYVSTAAGASTMAIARPRSRRTVALVAAAFLILAGVAAWGWLRPQPAPPVISYGLALPSGEEFLESDGVPPVIAPDGSFLAYVGPVAGDRSEAQIWIKRRNSSSATAIPGTVGVTDLTISPDSRSVAFSVGRQLKTVSLGGGVPVTIADSTNPGFGLAWLDDGSIAYSAAGGNAPELRLVPASGGSSAVLWHADTAAALYPMPVPGGHGILFSLCGGSGGCSEWAYDLRRHTAQELTGVGSRPCYAATGQLLFVFNGALMAVSFDRSRLELTGTPVALADSVLAVSISRTGTLVMLTGAGGSTGTNFQLVAVDQTGHETPIDTTFTFHVTNYASNQGWALSPDGTQLAIGLNTGKGDDIWLKPLPAGPASRITYNAAADYRPHWTPDGRSVIFASNRVPWGIYQRRADGAGSDSLLVKLTNVPQEAVLTHDRTWLLVRQGGNPGPGGRDIFGEQIGVDTALKPVLATKYDEEAIAPSPDGKWFAYQSDETGRTEVFIRSFPDVNDVKRQVSSGGGVAPLWSRDGRKLFFLDRTNDMMSVTVSPGATLTLGKPVKLFPVPDDLLQVQMQYYTPWDIGPDGRFIMVRTVGSQPTAATRIVVVENYFQELKAKLKQ
jgi:eukaryotic-like serine/threonine-protein kinase